MSATLPNHGVHVNPIRPRWRASQAVACITLLILLSLPWIVGAGALNVLTKIAIASVFALGFNLLWGQAGLMSFGHAAYYGLGTFASIYAMQAIERGFGLPSPLVPLVGALAGFAFGLVAGWFATLRTGVYFAMITVALAELVSAIAVKWEAMFGGEGGLRSVRTAWGPFALQTPLQVYYLTLLWLLVVLAGLWWLQRSPLGTVVRGIRERETRVAFLGYDVHLLKTLVFALSCAVSGLAGGLLAFSDESANMVLFQGAGSAFVVLNTVLGGAGVLLGPVLGAALTTSFGYYVANLTHYWMLYLGLLFVIVVLYAPNGLVGGLLAFATEARAGRRRWFGLATLKAVVGAVLLAVGTVLAVELVGMVCSAEYIAQRAGAAQWPAVRVLGVGWLPGSVVTWIAVLGPLVLGSALIRLRAPRAAALRGAAHKLVAKG